MTFFGTSLPFITVLTVGSVLGALGGSFLTVLVTRSPIKWGFLSPEQAGLRDGDVDRLRSFCPQCKTQLPWHALIPLVSFVALRGKCAQCASQISRLYPTLEGLGAIAGITAAILAPTALAALIVLVAFIMLIGLAAIDARTGYLPDRLTMPLAVLGIVASFTGTFVPVTESILGGVIGYGVFWGISAAYKKIRKQDGLGLGDAKLLAAIGTFTGIYALPFVILIGSASALAFVSITAVISSRKVSGETALRFGPYLALAGAIIIAGQLAISR